MSVFEKEKRRILKNVIKVSRLMLYVKFHCCECVQGAKFPAAGGL